MKRLTLALSALAFLSACALPRGAAMQSEIISEATADVPSVALYHVNRDTLPTYQAWPDNGNQDTYGWLKQQTHGQDSAISAGDRLDIVVWDSEDASLLSSSRENATRMKGLKVSTGGTIFLPFAGVVHVEGLSESGARKKVQRKMSEAVPSAQVQLSVTKGIKGSASVLSGVAKPGNYPIENGHYSVLNAIASAGGVHSRIKNPQVRLIRRGKVYTESLETLLENPKADTILQGGDKISVEEDERYFRSLGAAAKEAIVPFETNDLSALDAMSMIGGLSEKRADIQGILVLRNYDPKDVRQDDTGPSNERSVFVFNLASADGLFSAGQFDIQSKDTVLVTEAPIVSNAYALGILSKFAVFSSDIASSLR